jgi:hypothetical protein
VFDTRQQPESDLKTTDRDTPINGQPASQQNPPPAEEKLAQTDTELNRQDSVLGGVSESSNKSASERDPGLLRQIWKHLKNKRTYFFITQTSAALTVSTLPFEYLALLGAGASLGGFLSLLVYLSIKNGEVAKQNQKKVARNKRLREKLKQIYPEAQNVVMPGEPTSYLGMGTETHATYLPTINTFFLSAGIVAIIAFGLFVGYIGMSATEKEEGAGLDKQISASLLGILAVLLSLPHMAQASNLRTYQTSLNREYRKLNQKTLKSVEELVGAKSKLEATLDQLAAQKSQLEQQVERQSEQLSQEQKMRQELEEQATQVKSLLVSYSQLPEQITQLQTKSTTFFDVSANRMRILTTNLESIQASLEAKNSQIAQLTETLTQQRRDYIVVHEQLIYLQQQATELQHSKEDLQPKFLISEDEIITSSQEDDSRYTRSRSPYC